MSVQMFYNFDNDDPLYQPDNMHVREPLPKTISLNNNNLDYIVGEDGRIRGYSWNYGETCLIPISVNIPIRVPEDSYISDIIGDEPPISLSGHYLQKFYNTVDMRCWTMVDSNTDTNEYIWQEDALVNFPDDGDKIILLTPYMFGKTITANFLNFRKEQMLQFTYDDVNDTEIVIDVATSKKLLRGVHSLEIYISNNECNSLVGKYEIVIR